MPVSVRLVLLAALLPACVTPTPSDDGKDGTDTGDTSDTGDSGDTGGGGSGATIFDINDGTISIGEAVTLERVVISSPHTYGDDGLFIQDPAGGPKSGLYVWSYDGVGDIYAEPGDEVTVTGSVTDYYGWLEFVIESSDDVVITGSADVPAPVDLGDGSGVDWNDYESVPVKLTAQTIASENEYGVGRLEPAGIQVDNGFVNLDYTCRGSYDTLTGIIFYSYEEWSLNARTDDDAGAYTDAEVLDTTAAEIQRDGVCGPVRLAGLVATTDAWTYDKKAYFTAQDVGGGEYSGMTVFGDDLAFDIVVGDSVTVVGNTTEFYGLTEVRVEAETDVTVDGSGPVTVDEVASAPKDWEAWESGLVSLSGVAEACKNPAKNYGQCVTDWGITIDNAFYDYPWADGMVYDTLTGVIGYSYSTWTIAPRDADDVVVE